MGKEILKKIIEQLRKYEIIDYFGNEEEFIEWVSKLNDTQVSNFLSLDIELSEIIQLNYLLINEDLLNCVDYKERVKTLSKVKNVDGCASSLVSNLCKLNFLHSANFYKDIEMLSKADTARYVLWIIGKDDFINSPYHDEDLKLLVETHDIDKENPRDFLVSDALATVAGNLASIKSKYHREDMHLIATSGSSCLQMSGSCRESSLNNLAINEVSLNDKYHLENMKILATNPIAIEYLYILMTTPSIIKGEHYREEIEILSKAKGKLSARAMYYYIANPSDKFSLSSGLYNEDYGSLVGRPFLIELSNSIQVRNNEDYIENLKRLSKINDYCSRHYYALLINPLFINSNHKEFDLNLLDQISNNKIFMDLYVMFTQKNAINCPYHEEDANLISQIENDEIRKIMVNMATNEFSLSSPTHANDMLYLSKLDWDNLENNIKEEIIYYLTIGVGITAPNRDEKLEKLSQGIFVDRNEGITEVNWSTILLEKLNSDDYDFTTNIISDETTENVAKDEQRKDNQKVRRRIRDILRGRK